MFFLQVVPLECGDLLSYLDASFMPCVLEARLLGLWYMCFLELEKSMVLCVFAPEIVMEC